MITRTHLRARTALALGVAGALVLGGCSDADDEPTDTSSSAIPSPSDSLASSAVPEGVELTEPGSQLAFGDTATVSYMIRSRGTILDLTVNSAKQGSLKDFVGFDVSDALVRKANYYYVRVGVKNAGENQLGGVDVPLWGISGTNTLLPPVRFNSAFKKCPTDPLPEKFGPGDTFKTCLVFLSPNHGSLEGVSYRPVDSFDPIEWHGEVEKPAAKKSPKKPKKKSGKG